MRIHVPVLHPYLSFILICLILFGSEGQAIAHTEKSNRHAPNQTSDILIADEDMQDMFNAGRENSNPQDFDFSEEDFYDIEQEDAFSNSPDKRLYRYWQNFKEYLNSRMTLDYGYAYQLGNPKKVVVNRSSLRLELSHLFADRYFAMFDGKLTVYGPNDHIAEAEDKHILLESKLREAYLEANFNKLTIKAGKQILIWGESDTAVVTDLVSPRDLSELSYKNLEDSRIGQYMLVSNLYGKFGMLNAFINPFPEKDELPIPGSAYFITEPMPDAAQWTETRLGVDDTEYGLRWKQTFGKSDIAFMVADLVDNNPVSVFKGNTDSGKIILAKNYNRFKMAGFAGNLSRGSVIWKVEMAYTFDRSYPCANSFNTWDATQRDTIDTAIGLEFSPPSRLWNITVESAIKYIPHWDETLLKHKRSESAVTSIISRSLLNDTLDIEYTFLMQLRSADKFQKIRTEYELSDNLTGILEYGWFSSHNEDGPYWVYRHKQRILASIKLHF